MDVFNSTTTMDNGNSEKLIAMVSLGLGSFFAGMLPAFISERNRLRFPLITSLFLCFGAGILLATSLVHILPEVRKQMSSNFAEISLCGGFFIIYFIDEFIHYFFGEAIQHRDSNTPTTGNDPSSHHQNSGSQNYGSVISETTPLLANLNDQGHVHNNEDNISNGSHNHSHENHCDDAIVADANARICHTSHTEPCSETLIGTLGLFVALSLHSAIEGLAIGVQNSSTKVLFLLGAVACHKLVMGFCLGLEFRSSPQTTMKSHLIGILIFALGAVCGIGIGMIVVNVPTSLTKSTLAVIQAIAGGTLFYVTVCEVIPREKARWHQNRTRKAAGIAQLLSVFCGFTAMCVINYFLNDDDI